MAPSRYTVGDDIADHPRCTAPLPDAFTLETLVRVEPDHNTQLSGLYKSKDGYFTQCEAQGFRRITFYPDRPDVMARFSCTIEGRQGERFPQLLSNGNPVASWRRRKRSPLGALGRSLRQALPTSSPWSRPGSTCWKTSFTTRSGRKRALRRLR
jgi:hypothetical protein